MTYGLQFKNTESSPSQPTQPQKPEYMFETLASTRRCSDQQLLDIATGLKGRSISYIESKKQISNGECPTWLAAIKPFINLSEADIAFLLTNLKNDDPDYQQPRIYLSQYQSGCTF